MKPADFQANFETVTDYDGELIDVTVAYDYEPAEDPSERDGYYIAVFVEGGDEIFHELPKPVQRAIINEVTIDHKFQKAQHEYDSI